MPHTYITVHQPPSKTRRGRNITHTSSDPPVAAPRVSNYQTDYVSNYQTARWVSHYKIVGVSYELRVDD